MRPRWTLNALASKRLLLTAVVLCLAASTVGLAVTVAHVRHAAPPTPMVSGATMELQGFRSALYEGEHLRWRLSGDRLSLSKMRLWGPFSLGFLDALTGHNVTVETFASTGSGDTAITQALSLDRMSALLAQQRIGARLAQAELEPLTIIAHDGMSSRVVLAASACWTTLRSAGAECRNGTLLRDGAPVAFRELSYDARTGSIHTRP